MEDEYSSRNMILLESGSSTKFFAFDRTGGSLYEVLDVDDLNYIVNILDEYDGIESLNLEHIG